MPTVHFAYPGDLETRTGGYGYDRRIIAGLRDLGWRVELVPLGEGFPFPGGDTLTGAMERLSMLPEAALVVVDGLAYGVLPVTAAHARYLRIVSLLHHPLCLENGLDPDRAKTLAESEKAALRHVRHVIVTSPATAAKVHRLFDVPEECISTVLPGTEKPAPHARTVSDVTRLLCVGTVVPRKGYDLLLEALAEVPGAWHLDAVGGLDADPAYAAQVRRQAEERGLGGRITFHGAVAPEELEDFYRMADVFVLASRYEGYGMAYAEALAHGLPVIGSGGGAVRETLPEGAAIYCPVEDVAALHAALDRLVSDPGERSRLAAAARSAARDLPDWGESARRFSDILQGIAA
jgi:glycosyltransferase involved in cell wall biosynthesis